MPPAWKLTGSDWAASHLQAQIAEARLHHAYLITGPEGVGKLNLVLAFAKALNCTDAPHAGAYCDACRECRQIGALQHPDLLVLSRLEGDRDIKVDAVRELQRSLALAPYQASYKLALLRDFQHASHQAQNALLKTLEEPPARVILLLTSESAQSLLPTILSRCERLRLRPMAAADLAAALQKETLSAEQAGLLAGISAGRPAYARSLLEHPDLLEERQARLDEQGALLSAPLRQRFAYAKQASEDKEQLRSVVQIWASYWRDVLLIQTRSAAPLTNVDRRGEIEELAAYFALPPTRRFLQRLHQTLDLLETNANTRLALDALMLDWPRR